MPCKRGDLLAGCNCGSMSTIPDRRSSRLLPLRSQDGTTAARVAVASSQLSESCWAALCAALVTWAATG